MSSTRHTFRRRLVLAAIGLADGKALTDTAFASFGVAGVPGCHRIDLLAGRPIAPGPLAEPLVAFSVTLDQ